MPKAEGTQPCGPAAVATTKAKVAGFVKPATLAEARKLMVDLGCDPRGADIMAPKAVHACVRLEAVPLKAALVLKQELLAKGGDAALSRRVIALAVESTDMVIMGTVRQLREVATSLREQPFGLKAVGRELEGLLATLEGNAASP